MDRSVFNSSVNRAALLIDDNDDYAAMILRHLEPSGFHFERARSAKEGLEMVQKASIIRYRLIVTDITMEGQTAGLRLIRQIRRLRFPGVLMVASTGFNSGFVMFLSRIFMYFWGADILVPKDPLKRGEFVCRAITAKGKLFLAFL